ncbi:MAG: ABC transporter permease [Lachnospiraceae bacterium]|nr:ABC transporter permease [Lachnospiraceae bacterium]
MKRYNQRLVAGLVVFVLIIAMISTFSYSESEIEKTMFSIGFCDYDKTGYSEMALSYLKDNDNFSTYVNLVAGEEEELKRKISTGEIDAYLIIPEGFADNMDHFRDDTMEVVISTKDLTKSVLLSNVFMTYEKYVSSVQSNLILNYEILTKEGIDNEEAGNIMNELAMQLLVTVFSKENYFARRAIQGETIFHVPTMIFSFMFLLMMIIVMPIGISLLKKLEKGLTRKERMAGVSSMAMLFAESTPHLLLSSLLYVLGLVIIGREMNIRYTFSGIALSILCMMALILLYLFLALLTCNKNSYVLTTSLILFAFAMFGGSIIPRPYLPGFLQSVADISLNGLFANALTKQNRTGIASFMVLILFVIFVSSLCCVMLKKREERRFAES